MFLRISSNFQYSIHCYDKPRQHVTKQRHRFANMGPYSQTYGFPNSHVWMWAVDHKERRLSTKELMLLNCGIGEDSFFFLGEDSWVSWTARRSNQSILKEINPEYLLEGLMLKPKLQYFGSNLLENPWSWERLKARGEGGNRGQEGWMASLIQ